VAAREKIQNTLAKALAALPPRAQIALSGRPQVQLDGQRLHPETQLSLALLNRLSAAATIETVTPELARAERRRMAAVFGGRPEPVGAVRNLTIDGPVPLPARHYAPAELGGPRPLLAYFHGGGFVFGDLDTHDAVCRLLCRSSGAHVLAVDYRLAPENPFPAAVEDARGALAWAHAHAAQLGADPARVGVGGDSAGGNLAAVASQLAARDGGPAPAVQLLIYPATDASGHRRPSRDLFGEGFFLTNAEMNWFEASYFGSVAGPAGRDPRASPLLAEDLSGLAPAVVITAGFDPLRDEGEEYARALAQAGTPVVLRRFDSYIHGFISAPGVSRRLREAVLEIGAMTRAAFDLTATAATPGAFRLTSAPESEPLAAG
jgi:acetyl esterase